jgi:probable HAF family extracellular repeat protein
VVVGEATDGSGFWRAFRWTAATGMVDIGTLGGPESAAYATNKDGSVIVGDYAHQQPV